LLAQVNGFSSHHPGMPANLPTKARNATKQIAWRRFLTAHALATRKVDEDLKSSGNIPYDWYDVLMGVSEAENGRLSMGKLADFTLLTLSGMTRRVQRMEQEGLILRERDAADGRSFIVSITPKGRKALQRAWVIYEKTIQSVFESEVTEAEAKTLLRVFQRITEKAGTDHRLVKTGALTEKPR
jgi:DNA-binding MarR family transcriptional regulator